MLNKSISFEDMVAERALLCNGIAEILKMIKTKKPVDETITAIDVILEKCCSSKETKIAA